MTKLKILSLFLFSILLLSCNQNSDFVIKGKWDDAVGKYVYLKIADSTNNHSIIDSSIVDNNNNFEIRRSIPELMQPAQFFAGKQKENIVIYNSKQPIEIEVKNKDIKVLKRGETDSSTITISEINIVNPTEEIIAYQKGQDVITSSALISLGSMVMLMEAQEKGHSLDSIIKVKEELTQNLNKTITDYIDSSKNCIATTFFIKDYILREKSLNETKDFFNQLTEYVKNSAEGKALYKEIEKIEKVNIGGTPDNFSLPTPDGNEISLESFRGNYLIIDFWASWCAPCLAEAPNLKKIYDKWGGKGLEILGISLDKEKDREKWINAISKNNLNWPQVSSLNGWDCPIAKRFNITAIPRMYILDKEGKIINQDIRGDVLSNTIDSLLTK
jgi:Peroxiredoxin